MREGSSLDRFKRGVSRDLQRVANKIGPVVPRVMQRFSDASKRGFARLRSAPRPIFPIIIALLLVGIGLLFYRVDVGVSVIGSALVTLACTWWSSREFSEWANGFNDFKQEILAFMDAHTREERERHASSLLESLEGLIAKSAPGGHQMDIIAKVFEGDRLLAEKVFLNLSTANAVGAPIAFQNLRIEIVAHPIGGGAHRQAAIRL